MTPHNSFPDAKPLDFPPKESRHIIRRLARRRFFAAIMAGTAVALSACGDGDEPDVTTESTGPVLRDGAFDTSMKGAWRVLGEGRLLEIGDQEIKQFQETNSICYLDRQVIPAMLLEGYAYRQSTTPDRVTVDLHATASTPSGYTLERLPQVPDHCRKEPPTDSAAIFKTMWDMFELDYGFFQERNINWPARFSSLQPRAAAAVDEDALQAVLVEAIHDFNDYHVSLIRFKDGEPIFEMYAADTPTYRMLEQAYAQQSDISNFEAFQAQWRNSMQATMSSRLVAGTEERVLNGAMAWGKLPDNIGYIQMSRMEGFSDDTNTASDLKLVRAEMDRAIAALADTKAIIFDIAVHDGGYDVVSAEVAGRFADRRRLAFTVQQHRPQGRKNQEWFVEPKGERQYLKPVYLLTTDRTVSAGDTLTLMMRELPHITHIGQPTSGSISNKLAKSLPGNFMVTFSNESYFDSKGILYEGRGVPPKLGLQVFYPSELASLSTGHDVAISKVIDIIGH